MKITTLLFLSCLFANAKQSQLWNQKVILPQLGLMWMKYDQDEKKGDFAVAISFNTFSNERLYAGKLIAWQAKDAMGTEIELTSNYEFSKGRSVAFCTFSRMPQGEWVELKGNITMGTEYVEENYALKLNSPNQTIQGDGFALACSVAAERPQEFIYHEKGFVHATWMDFVDEKGATVNPLANRTIEATGNSRAIAFVFASDVDLSKLSFKVTRREAKNAQIVPVDLRFNIAGQSLPTASSVSKADGSVVPPLVTLAPIAESIGRLRWDAYSLTRRAGVSRGRYEATNFGIVLTPSAGKAMNIKPRQKIEFNDGTGRTYPAELSFVTPRANGDILLSFRIDATPSATPFVLHGRIEGQQEGKSMSLPLRLDVSGFPQM